MNYKSQQSGVEPAAGQIDRRQFLQRASFGAVALSFSELPRLFKDMSMGVVVHSYASRWNSKADSTKYPGFTHAIDLLTHCHQIGAGGVQVVVKGWSADFARRVRSEREKLGLYMEGSIGLPKKTEEVPVFEQEVKNAREAGARVLRTVSLGGRRYEEFTSYQDFEEFKKKALLSLQLAEPVLRRNKIRLGIENHKDWLAKELVEVLQKVDSEWVGVTLDFGNSLALMEDPMEVVQTLAPYVCSTHVKDMAVEEYPDGFLLSEVPLGKGFLDLPKIISLCKKYNPEVTFNLEMITRDPLEIPCLKSGYWATFKGVTGSELARTLQMVRQHNYSAGLPKVSQLNAEQRLAIEEENILTCLSYSKNTLGLR